MSKARDLANLASEATDVATEDEATVTALMTMGA